MKKVIDNTTKIIQTEYRVGMVYRVALKLIELPPVELTARWGVGNNFVSVYDSIKEHGQRIPCGAQLLSEEQKAAKPGKLFLLTEGAAGRYEVAKALGLELDVLIHEPYTDRQILERNVSTFEQSMASVMDISAAAIRLANIGLDIDAQCKSMSWAVGKGKPMGKGRIEQYKRLARLPMELQKMAHMGPINGGILPSAVLHMTNTNRTIEQYEAIINAAKDRIKREAAEQWDRDKAWMERDKDDVIKAAAGAELGPRPEYVSKRRARAADAPPNVDDIKGAEKEIDGVDPNKADKRPDPNPPVAAGTPMTHDEWVKQCAEVAAMGGIMVEAAELLMDRHTHRISSESFCTHLKRLIENGRGEAKVERRKLREKAGHEKPLEVVK